MVDQLWFTKILNHLLGPAMTSLLRQIGIHPAHPEAPITNIVSMEVLAVILLIVFFFFVRATLSVEKPGRLQLTVEMAEDFIAAQAKSIIGHDYQHHLPFLLALGFFILLCNLLGLVPGFESPTTNPSVPLGCAVATFIYYHWYGIRQHGFKYIEQFLGPMWQLAWLMFPIEAISHLARILSLTVRLYANMFAGDMVTMAFFSLVPFLVPVLFLGLHLFVALVQTFIFVILATVYIGMAVSEEH
jgi:F-type H+-transporting ATPase subunit a